MATPSLSVFSVPCFRMPGCGASRRGQRSGDQNRWSESGRASVYLKPEATPAQIQAIESALRSTPGVTDVRFVSSEDARQEVLGSSKSDVLSALPAEAFPASLEVPSSRR